MSSVSLLLIDEYVHLHIPDFKKGKEKKAGAAEGAGRCT